MASGSSVWRFSSGCTENVSLRWLRIPKLSNRNSRVASVRTTTDQCQDVPRITTRCAWFSGNASQSLMSLSICRLAQGAVTEGGMKIQGIMPGVMPFQENITNQVVHLFLVQTERQEIK